MTSQEAVFQVNGEELVGTTAGACWWPDYGALLVADLHLEKGTAFARKGVLLPPYDTRTTLKRLAVLKARYQPKMIISLGDAFHDIEAEDRMDAEDAVLLGKLMNGVEWVWIRGNHDPLPPARFAAEVTSALKLGRLRLVHEPTEGPADGEVGGHLHPCARVKAAARLIRRRCFATDGRRMILPAFGAYAGGLNVLDTAYAGIFDPCFTAWVLGGKGVYPFSGAKLVGDTRPIPLARPAVRLGEDSLVG